MRCEPHPISGFIYQGTEDGNVRVENPGNGQWGLFDCSGKWLNGDLTHVDLHFAGFIAGADLRPGADVASRAMNMLGGLMPENMPRQVARYVADAGMDTPLGKRSAGYIEQDYLLDNDRKAELLPDAYRLESPMEGGPTRIPVDRFIDPEFHDLEVERLWKKVWQMACHVDDIPEVGDYVVYNIANLSYLIVRTGEQEFKAHENVCLHRGRILKECDGKSATEFRCPYHGWSWKLDGSIKQITCEWDFPGVREDVSQLPGARVAVWGGMVFINPDPDASSLEEFLGPVMMAHYEKFALQNRHKRAHAVRVMPANWKSAMEAFMEGWHVVATHPQLMLMGTDCGSFRYDVWGHWGRAGHLVTGCSPQRGQIPDKKDALAIFQQLADDSYNYLRNIIGDEVDQYSDAELNDVSFNDLFPNLHPWGGWAEIVFRFRPNGNNPDECLMDVILLSPWPKDKPKPPAAKPRMIGNDESWCAAPELGMLARIIDQDVANMAALQTGMKAKKQPYLWYSAYQEGKIRNFHRNYERWLGLESSFD